MLAEKKNNNKYATLSISRKHLTFYTNKLKSFEFKQNENSHDGLRLQNFSKAVVCSEAMQ